MKIPKVVTGLCGGALLALMGTSSNADVSLGLGRAAAQKATTVFGKADAARRAANALPPCVPNTTEDWMVQLPTTSAVYLQINPADCAELNYQTPTFNWPIMWGVTFELTWTDEGGRSRRVTTPVTQNWYIPDTPLAPGRYAWTVKTSSNKLSATRHFTILAGADPFEVPSPDEMVARASALPHPRGFPRGAEKDAFLTAALGTRLAKMNELAARATARIGKPLPLEPSLSDFHTVVQNVTFGEETAILDALLAWKVLGRDDLLADAKRRAENLLTWDPNGTTSHEKHDQGNRAITWALTNYYDWNYSNLSSTERSALLNMIKARSQAVGSEIRIRESIKNLHIFPYDSHGFDAAGRLAAIGALLAGDLPEAGQWLKEFAPVYLDIHCPWGGEDGGYANGTNYGTWQAGHIINWQVLRWTTGVDMRQKGWSKSYGKFLAYFLPPGQTTNVFGDGAEQTSYPVQPYGRAYINNTDNPFYRWYASQFPATSHYLELFSPGDSIGPAFIPGDMGPSALFPNIGWAALHSSLSDPQRTSIYFKSSFYGSFSHNHADQNSFVLQSKGKNLLIDSGYYDDYNSAHWRGWYKLTRAHNAITFDGGQGQSIDGSVTGDFTAKGKITQFSNADPGLDLVTGDAGAAYSGKVTKSIRSMAYLRPDVLVVFDALASTTPRNWEWNLHSYNATTFVSSSAYHYEVKVTTADASVCVDLYSPDAFTFSQTSAFSVDPSPASSFPNQWHGRYRVSTPALQGSFATVLRVNCSPHTVSVTSTGASSWNATVDGTTLVFDGNSVRRE
jgi:hypothetical protein